MRRTCFVGLVGLLAAVVVLAGCSRGRPPAPGPNAQAPAAEKEPVAPPPPVPRRQLLCQALRGARGAVVTALGSRDARNRTGRLPDRSRRR